MSKIIAWLTGGVIEQVGNVIDKLTTTKEEKLEIKKQLQVILEKAEANAQEEVTSRWKSDMSSDSFLSKNITAYGIDIPYLCLLCISFCRRKRIGHFQDSCSIYTYIPNATSHCLRCLLSWVDRGRKRRKNNE